MRATVPITPEENELCMIEDVLFGNQLAATEYYRFFPSRFLADFIFTGDLKIWFRIISTNPIESVAVEETYVLSDHQCKDRLRAGEDLDQIVDSVPALTANC